VKTIQVQVERNDKNCLTARPLDESAAGGGISPQRGRIWDAALRGWRERNDGMRWFRRDQASKSPLF